MYDGQEISVEADEVADGELELAVRTPDGTVAATGQATRPARAPAFDISAYPTAPLPGRDARPAASFEALPPGTLGSLPAAGFHAEYADIFLAQIDDDLPLYKAGAVAHPGWLIQAANEILSSNVKLGPWIHVSSQATLRHARHRRRRAHHAGRVVETFERKGHKFVDLDVLVVANDTTPVMHARHQAIFEPRRSS